MITSLSVVFHILIAVAYLALFVLALHKRGFNDALSRFLAVYLGLAALWEFVLATQWVIFTNLVLPKAVVWHLPYYGLVLLAFLLLTLNTTFLQDQKPHWGKWLLLLLWLGAALTLDFNWFFLPDSLWQIQTTTLHLADISFELLVLGWGLLTVLTIRITLKAYRQTERIVIRHRITYWALGLLLSFAGHMLFLGLLSTIGSIFTLLGAIALYYILTVHRLPDLKMTLRRFLSAVLVGLLEIVIYTAGFWVMQKYLSELAGYSPVLAGAVLAFVLLVLFNPLLSLIQKWVNRLIFGTTTDTAHVLREYSQSISNILDLSLLSTVAVGLISEVFEVQNGLLFTVDTEFGESGGREFRLRGIPGMGVQSPVNAKIPSDSPITTALGDECRTLMRSEIDVLPEFRYLSPQERSWLNSQDMDVYIPIHAKDDWIGILALGPKSSGASYTDADLDLLTTIANQTAVALQNARLVNSLVRINNEFRRAYSSMQEAHEKLERIDRTKSDFISIASHELRTPLTVLSGYSQMLMDDPTFKDNPYYAKVISGIYDGTSRLHEIVDSMLDVAKIDTRALELQSEPVHLHVVIGSVCQGFKKAFQERNLTLDLDDFSNLPSVQGDPEALKKVFYHLVMNAIKYTPDGGKITITGFLLEKGDKNYPPGGVSITVSDTGIGVDPRFKDLIFTKFYQTGKLALHSSGKVKFKGGGPGLGLAIVSGIVQAHGGRVWVESPGHDEEKTPGSHFHVALPIENSDGKVTPPGEIDI
ncbi:MAG TPA: hypothetical protein EYP88_01045 [Anaerolineales bacterium]|nr:hypothetical protein [Anaerolineales bacterium]